MRPNFVLIDFENVQPSALISLDKDHFRVLVFLGASQTKVSLDLARALQRMGPKAEYIQISGNGPNALDFHIAFYVGQLAGKHPDAFFHIISKDKGFDPLIEHLKAHKIFCLRSLKIDDIPLVRGTTLASPQERAMAVLERLRRPGATLPRTEKTLISSINNQFQKVLTGDELQAILNSLKIGGHIDTSNPRKIDYHLGEAPS